jgi:hypothetical protein
MITSALAALTLVASVAPTFADEAPAVQSYQTRNGPRTADQLTLELTAAGYNGPWDAASMLSAYQGAAPEPTPIPIATPASTPQPAAPAPLPPVQYDRQAQCVQFATDESLKYIALMAASHATQAPNHLYETFYNACMGK